MVCSSVHLMTFCKSLARIAEDNGFHLARMPIAQLFPQPAPHWVWSDERETNFDRLAFHAPKKINLSMTMSAEKRERLNARLLQCWVAPPLHFFFLFASTH